MKWNVFQYLDNFNMFYFCLWSFGRKIKKIFTDHGMSIPLPVWSGFLPIRGEIKNDCLYIL